MKNLHTETGCLYDTMAFLSRYFAETIEDGAGDTFFNKIKETLKHTGIAIPQYLYPLLYRYNDRPLFLLSLLLDGPYSGWNLERTTTILKNKQYLRRRFSEYFFDSSDQAAVFKKLTEHPGGIEMIKKREFDPEIEVYIYYIFIHFDEIIQSLTEIIQTIYNAVNNEHNDFLTQSSFMDSVQNSVTAGKLSALAQSKNEILKFGLTLMDETMLGLKDTDPGFILLGYKYETILDTRYKYINADPYSFAQAIGNPARYDIYKVLLNESPMSRFEMKKTLHLSRAALDHNLKVMRKTGLLIVDHQEGLTNFYKLDPDYIRTATGHILEGVNRR